MDTERIKDVIKDALRERIWRTKTDLGIIYDDEQMTVGGTAEAFRVPGLKRNLMNTERMLSRFNHHGTIRPCDFPQFQGLLRRMSAYFHNDGESPMEYGEEREALARDLKEAAKLANLRKLAEETGTR